MWKTLRVQVIVQTLLNMQIFKTSRACTRTCHSYLLLYYVFFLCPDITALFHISAPQRAKNRLLRSDSSDLANLVETALLNLQFIIVFFTSAYNISRRGMETETVFKKKNSYCIPRATKAFESSSKAQGDHVIWHYFWHKHAATIHMSASITNKHPAPLFLLSVVHSLNREYTSK